MSRPILGRHHYRILTIAFLLFVIYGSLVPLHFESVDFEVARAKFFKRMARGISFDMRSDWAANVLLFIPLGFFCMGFLTADRPKPWMGLALVPFFALLSGAIEFAQIWFPPRDTNLNDIVAETMGGVIGVVGWLMLGQSGTVRIRQFLAGYGPGDWAIKALPAYLMFLVFTEGMPFDLTISPTAVRHKIIRKVDENDIRNGLPMAALTPPAARVPEKSFMTIAYFLPVGVLLACLPGSRWRNPASAGQALLAGLAAAGGIEILQLCVVSCSAYATDVPAGAVCVLAGWWVAIRPGRLSRAAWITGLSVWMLALMAVSWFPWVGWADAGSEDFSRFVWMPFREYIDNNYLNGMNKIVHRTMAYVPVGFLCGRAFQTRLVFSAFLGAALGVIVEGGQLLFTDHTASVSDVILGCLGCWCGAVVAKRAGKSRPVSDWEPPANRITPVRLL